MKTIIKLTMLICISILCSCQEEELINAPSNSDKVNLSIKLSDFDSKTITTKVLEGHAGYTIATERELKVNNGKVFVFSRNGTGYDSYDKLLEVRNITVSESGLSGQLAERNSPIVVFALANLTEELVAQITADAGLDADGEGIPAKDYNYSQFVTLKVPYDATNKVLKNNDEGLLFMYSEPKELDELKNDSGASGNKNVNLHFAYSRVDVQLKNEGTQKIMEIGALNVPNVSDYFNNSILMKSHKVTPASNLDHSTEHAKYVEGLYMYPRTAASVEGNKIYIIIKLDTEDGERYHKLLFRHSKSGEEYQYHTLAGVRYLINITAIHHNGYTTEEEAISMPPGNVEYSITVDDESNYISANGSYYIGVAKREYTFTYTNTVAQEGNNYLQCPELYEDLSAVEKIKFSDETKMGLNPDSEGGVYFDLFFHYNKSEDINFDASTPAKSIILPEGIIYHKNVPAGYGSENNWGNTFGLQKIRFSVLGIDPKQEITIKIGELEQKVAINTVKDKVKILPIDYSSKTLVNSLTGLSGDGRGNTDGLRVANSYIVNPHPRYPITYYIPVEDRINEFWTGYTADPNNTIVAGVDWTNDPAYEVKLMWYNGGSISYSIASKGYSAAIGQNVIKVDLPANCEHQNAVVNVVKNGVVIWSWHLWITDYVPYSSKEVTVNKHGVGVKEVQRGELHRYANAAFQSGGLYKDKLIMDRYLGATDATEAGQSGGHTGSKGSLHYQYGRKDPITTNAKTYINGYQYAVHKDQVSMDYAINNPNKWYAVVGNWTVDYQNFEYSWNEKNTSYSKSIFDPSPLGFKVPKKEVWKGISKSDFPALSDDDELGRLYKGTAFYPHTGYTENNPNSPKVGVYVDHATYSWSATPSKNTNPSEGQIEDPNGTMYGASLYIPREFFELAEPNYRAAGFPVRPIQE